MVDREKKINIKKMLHKKNEDKILNIFLTINNNNNAHGNFCEKKVTEKNIK